MGQLLTSRTLKASPSLLSERGSLYLLLIITGDYNV